MSPQEKFNRDIWYVLQQLKQKSFYIKTGGTISYAVNYGFFDLTGGSPSAEEESLILEKLEELGVIKIRNKGWEYE